MSENMPYNHSILLRALTRVVALACWFAAPLGSHAQSDAFWGKVDTLTTGLAEEFHPVVPHEVWLSQGSPPDTWMVFERRTATESQIAAKRFNMSSNQWDSTVTVISASPASSPQQLPDIAHLSTTGKPLVVSWQWWKEGRWQVWYSTRSDSAPAWSSPQRLVQDTVDNTAVQLRPYNSGSVAIATWKRRNVLEMSFWTPSAISAPETLVVSAVDTFEYDLALQYDYELHGQALTVV
ncbi:MAG TPA: hypothetical protein VF898_10360, partial [Chloroflexota bacterium]